MKTSLKLLSLVLVVFLVNGCKKDDDRLDKDGLTKSITDLVPQEILDEMRTLGMPINGGGKPPVLNATFYVSTFILVSSNRSSDYPGQSFAPYTVTFSGQDNDDLSINVDYVNGPESGNGLGSFIVGDKNKFSVFVEINSTISGTTAKFIHVLSGELVNDGIKDFYYANFMLDDNGDPAGVWIENGDGRVIYDSDGFSEKQ
jgi:hypothetical protein